MRLKEYPVQFHLHSNGNAGDIHAIGAQAMLNLQEPIGAWSAAKKFLDDHVGKYIFTSFSYELKDDIEALCSNNPSFTDYPALILVVPQVVFTWELGEIEVLQLNDRSVDIDLLKRELIELHRSNEILEPIGQIESISSDEYLDNLKRIQEHIQRGDIYELNYCQEFRAEQLQLDPWAAFRSLNDKTRAPYSCHVRFNDLHLLCGSPELFLEKVGNTVRSKPIKGTRKRSRDPQEDEILIDELRNDLKERAENIMITDLVRNDLSRTALPNSVVVEELCEVYSYQTVHQMTSTIRSQVSEETHPIDIIRSCFPMGSMTGAPKIRAMELIEEYESFKRGIYSGSIGFIGPDRDFTLNVVIRSILYDQNNQRACVAAGGAITALSEPELEYEESLLKARAMLDVLGFEV